MILALAEICKPRFKMQINREAVQLFPSKLINFYKKKNNIEKNVRISLSRVFHNNCLISFLINFINQSSDSYRTKCKISSHSYIKI